MPQTHPTSSGEEPASHAGCFYRHVMQSLNEAGVPFLVGGAYAFARYTGFDRYTKDLDLFIVRRDYQRLCEAMQAAGYKTELTHAHWLAKVRQNGELIDLIFNAGNGVAEVDDEWFAHAPSAQVLGLPARLTPVEEMVWSKAFIMERERYDGADIAHLVHARARELDWHRLLRRFGPHWRVLLSHLVLYGFIYSAERDRVPAWVMDDLLERLRAEGNPPAGQDRVCAGTLLSREQFLVDIEQQGYEDARLRMGTMSAAEVAQWTESIPRERRDAPP